MRIGCPQCSTEFELNPPTGRSGKRRRIKFRCTVCGTPCDDSHGLEASGDEPSYSSEPSWNPSASNPPAPVESRPEVPFETAGAYDDSLNARFEAETGADEGDPALQPFRGADGHPELDNPEGTLLKQEGKVYHVRNLATIQRWIVERRVLREDLISTGGMRWEPVGHHPDLEIFFQMVERLDELELSSRLPPQELEHDLKPPVSDETPMGNSLSGVEPAVPDMDPWDAPDPGAGLLEEVEAAEEAEEAWFAEHEPEEVDDAQVYASAPSYAYEDSEPSDYLEGDDGIPSFDQALSNDATLWDDDPEREADPAVVFVSKSQAEEASRAADEPAPTLAPADDVPSTEELSAGDFPGFADSEQAPTERLQDEDAPGVPDESVDSLDASFGHYQRAEGVQLEHGGVGDDDDDLAWVEDRGSQRLRVFAAVAVLALALVAVLVWKSWEAPATPEPGPVTAEVEEPPVEEPPVEEPPVEEPPVEEPPVEEPPVAEVEPDPPKQDPPKKDLPKQDPPKKDPPKQDPPKKEPPKQDAPPATAPKASKNAAQWTEAGWSAMDNGDFRGARSAFVEALAQNPRHADALYGLGYAAQTQGDRSFAIQNYCMAIDNANGRQDILREVPVLLSSLGGSCD